MLGPPADRNRGNGAADASLSGYLLVHTSGTSPLLGPFPPTFLAASPALSSLHLLPLVLLSSGSSLGSPVPACVPPSYPHACLLHHQVRVYFVHGG